jgi:hypothetical protein
MKKYLIAIVIAFGALFGLSVQAAPLTENTTAIQNQIAQQGAAQKVYYRHGWRRGYGWRGYGWRGHRCRLRCNPRRCWRVCW